MERKSIFKRIKNLFGKKTATLDYFKNVEQDLLNMHNINLVPDNNVTITIPQSPSNVYSISTGAAINPSVLTAAAQANPGFTGQVSVGGAGGAGGIWGTGQWGNFTINSPVSSTIVTYYGNNNTEVVRLNSDGTVTWANGIDVDAAAEAFAKSMTLGAEITAGITSRVKLEMRDSVFNDIIAIAKEKGSLTAEDLTYLLEASKIVEKLKGGDK